MGSQIVNGLLGCLPENTTAWVGEAVPVVTQVASAAIGALSELSYLQIGGSGLVIFGGYLIYRYFDENDVEARAFPLMRDDMDGSNKARILNVIRQIRSGDREDVIDRALPLMQDSMCAREKAAILDAIRCISSKEREDVIQLVLPLMRDDLDGYGKSEILYGIQPISSAERGDLIDRVSILMPDDMTAGEKGRILQSIAQFPSRERKDVIQLAFPFMRNAMRGHQKAYILEAIRGVPLAERNQQTARALEQLQIDFPGGEIDDINIYYIRIIQLLETPLHQAFLPLGENNAMAAAAAAGHGEINVHAGNRDARVEAALLLLRKSQNMTEQEINSSADKCIEYLKEDGQSRALWVLNGPNNPNDYGPFFKEIIINGESTSGREVIGRLWGFIQALPESEKQLALDSLVTGLNNCVNENGERVCDQGKMQHLFIAVLQGRLPEVEVDDSIKIPKIDQGESSSSASSQEVPVEEAMRLFFEHPKHREIVEFEELLEAAKDYCVENPLVNQEEFIEETKVYAEKQGIDSKGKEEE